MSDWPGMGVMINMLGGRSQEHVDELKNSFNHKIKSIKIENNNLKIEFDDYPTLNLSDRGQSCCESRYMVCDDSPNEFIGSNLLDIKIEDGPSIEAQYEEHEVQFLKLVTDRGIITVSNHNEHNGYYGGFWIDWSLEK